MARVIFVQHAQKDYPDRGIKKGEPYYWWKPNFGAKHFSKTPPKPSQVTTSAFMGTFLGIQEQADESRPTYSAELEDSGLESWRDDLVSELESLRDETQEKLDNMPEGLQQGDTGQMLQERVDGVESIISDLESASLDWPETPERDKQISDADWEKEHAQMVQEREEAVQSFTDEVIGAFDNASLP